MKLFAKCTSLGVVLTILCVVPAMAESKTPAQFRNELFGTPLPPDEVSPSRLADLSDARAGTTTLYLEFPNGSAKLSTIAMAELANLLIALKSPEAKGRRLEISGHTSQTGSAASNLVLSQHRAEAVRQYMEENNLPTDNFSVIGYGFNKLLNKSDPAAAKNRRVEIRVLD